MAGVEKLGQEISVFQAGALKNSFGQTLKNWQTVKKVPFQDWADYTDARKIVCRHVHQRLNLFHLCRRSLPHPPQKPRSRHRPDRHPHRSGNRKRRRHRPLSGRRISLDHRTKTSGQHRFNPPACPNANADVESVHHTVETELFEAPVFSSRADCFAKTAAYQLWHHAARKNSSRGYKSPADWLALKAPDISPTIFLLHPHPSGVSSPPTRGSGCTRAGRNFQKYDLPISAGVC